MEVGDVYCDIETDKATVSFDCQNECACPSRPSSSSAAQFET